MKTFDEYEAHLLQLMKDKPEDALRMMLGESYYLNITPDLGVGKLLCIPIPYPTLLLAAKAAGIQPGAFGAGLRVLLEGMAQANHRTIDLVPRNAL